MDIRLLERPGTKNNPNRKRSINAMTIESSAVHSNGMENWKRYYFPGLLVDRPPSTF